MIPAGVEIFVALEPIDMRCGFNRLTGMAREQLGCDPKSGALFVFFGKKRHAVKILFHDGSGICLFYKRLDKKLFRLLEAVEPGGTHVEVNELELDILLDGVEIENKHKTRKVVH